MSTTSVRTMEGIPNHVTMAPFSQRAPIYPGFFMKPELINQLVGSFQPSIHLSLIQVLAFLLEGKYPGNTDIVILSPVYDFDFLFS